jgi:hypothetical protein
MKGNLAKFKYLELSILYAPVILVILSMFLNIIQIASRANSSFELEPEANGVL